MTLAQVSRLRTPESCGGSLLPARTFGFAFTDAPLTAPREATVPGSQETNRDAAARPRKPPPRRVFLFARPHTVHSLLHLRHRGHHARPKEESRGPPPSNERYDRSAPKIIVHYINRPSVRCGPSREAGPPFTFKISMLHVFCGSHGFRHFAALFIDSRAE